MEAGSERLAGSEKTDSPSQRPPLPEPKVMPGAAACGARKTAAARRGPRADSPDLDWGVSVLGPRAIGATFLTHFWVGRPEGSPTKIDYRKKLVAFHVVRVARLGR